MAEIDIELKLYVPQEQARRDTLVRAAYELIALRKILPPVSFQEIENLGKVVLRNTGGGIEELAFAMLMCNNELWRPYFEATPYSRRLLLMPQCLKNNGSCKGIIDEIGLICMACNACQLNSVIQEAESLGYETLIAEGSTMAIKLVEEGTVDAILGVSCMEVLKKSFKHTLSSAIPAIALPLLNDGCKDTETDQEWLLRELRRFTRNDHLQPLSISLMGTYIQNLFSETLLNEDADLGTNQTITGVLAVKSILQGGKRMRPMLAYMAYMAYSRKFEQLIADQLMLIIECFHKASLIHDDIEDNDNYRYGKKTVHHENGIPIAINLGDYLIGLGYRKLSAISLPDKEKLLLFKLFSEMHVESTLGQGEELNAIKSQTVFNTGKIIQVFNQKTSSAIKVSLLSGAIAAGAPSKELETLKNISDLLGVAYQIRDDLSEFNGSATDQQTASFPFLKSLLTGNPHFMPDNSEQWTELIVKNNVEQRAKNILDNTLQELIAIVNTLSSQKLRLGLLNLLNRVFEL